VKKSRFTEAQIVAILKEFDAGTADRCERPRAARWSQPYRGALISKLSVCTISRICTPLAMWRRTAFPWKSLASVSAI